MNQQSLPEIIISVAVCCKVLTTWRLHAVSGHKLLNVCAVCTRLAIFSLHSFAFLCNTRIRLAIML